MPCASCSKSSSLTLAAEVLEIEASPSGRFSVRLGEAETRGFATPNVVIRRSSTPYQQMPGWASGLSQPLEKFSEVWVLAPVGGGALRE